MIQKKKFSIDVAGKTLTLEISPLAEQANAAVLAKYGETVVLVTVVMSNAEIDADYMPLRVDYEERFYAAGKIIGSRFIRREGRPSEEAILAGRLVDRTIRPLFNQRLRREIQVVVTVLALEEDHAPDFVGLMAASTALGISNIPWSGPVAGVRVAKVNSAFLVNPEDDELKKDNFALGVFVAGPAGKINMIELCGKEAKEEDIIKALELGQKEIDRLVDFQKSIIKEIGKPKASTILFEPKPELKAEVDKFLAERLEEAIYVSDKAERENNLFNLKQELLVYIKSKFGEVDNAKDGKSAEFLLEDAIDHLVHKNILESDRRPDGRALDEVRELNGEIRLFERTHGSALFVRGNTQSLAVTTLAPPGAEQLVETMETTTKRRFMLHYNFPPYSVGEIGAFRGPGRREIGHGALASKALLPLIPPLEEFPYTIRVVSEILSSNGSSSMATVCASSLSLMDAGVPIKKPAAGIAMGLIMETQTELSQRKSAPAKFKILTDIQGPEDHYGDMDFKVAGTKDGVTAAQMDVKADGVSMEIIGKTLEQSRTARLHILKFMDTMLSAPRPEISKYAPKIVQIKINPEKIGMVIGPGGKMINGLIQRLGLVSIDIEEDGTVSVAADTREKVDQAVSEIKMLVREFKVGDIIDGRVVRILDFGAIVDLGGGQDGMIHISELKNGYVKNAEEVVHVGDLVKAKVIRVDTDGKIGLSLKQLPAE